MMTSSVLEWINESFFEKVLRSSSGDKNLNISEFNVAPSNTSQEHYASTIFKATVKYANKFNCEEVTKLLIKLVVPKAIAFSDENSFDTELNMYLSTLPDLQRLLNQNGENIQFAPKLLYSSKDPVPLLVLEDATMNGYENSPGLLDLYGTKCVASKLAKFHAASIYIDRDVMIQNYHTHLYSFSHFKGKEVSYYKNGLFNLKSRDGLNFMKNNMYLFVDELKSWRGYDECTEKLKNIAKKFEELGEKVYQANPSADGFNVLNHGDFHYNNMLFKKDDDGKVCDVLFVDYQMTKWGSPCIDLYYLLHLVASRDVSENHREEIINYYYQELVKSLKDIGYMTKPPNMLDLNVELLKNGFLEVLISICFMPFMFMDPKIHDVDVAFENGIEGLLLRQDLYRLPEFKTFIKKQLPKFLHRGLLL